VCVGGSHDIGRDPRFFNLCYLDPVSHLDRYYGRLALTASVSPAGPDLAHIVPRMKAECGELQSLPSPQADAMTARWVRLAQTSADFLDGVLLNAARHLSVMHGMQAQPAERQRYADVAVRYKLACVRAVSAAIVRERRPARYDDVVVAGTMVLAFDEVSLHRPS